MQLVINNFAADFMPVELSLPFLDYGSWEDSTAAKQSEFASYDTWRYQMDASETGTSTPRIRIVFLNGPSFPSAAAQTKFDIGRFWRIGNLLAEHALASHFSQQGFLIEQSHFEKVALRPYLHPLMRPLNSQPASHSRPNGRSEMSSIDSPWPSVG
jgi:hypothetical protein